MIRDVLWIRSPGQIARAVSRPTHQRGSLEHETELRPYSTLRAEINAGKTQTQAISITELGLSTESFFFPFALKQN